MSKLEEKNTPSTNNGHISDEEIATLNVVQEEITLPRTKWNRSVQSGIVAVENKIKDFALDQNFELKRRSDTWSGQVCRPVAHQKSFSSEVILNQDSKPVKRSSVPLNGFLSHDLNHLNSGNAHKRHSFESNKQQFYSQDSNNISDISSNENLNNVNVLKSDTEQTLSNSICENTFSKIDDLSSEFTDINLHTTNVPSDVESENSLKFLPVKQSSRPSLGSLFGWISSPKGSSESATNSSQNSPSRSKLMNNHSPHQSNRLAASDESKDIAQQTSGQKITKKSLKENLKIKSKGRFWWTKPPEEPLSTTALILENRPSNLPEKSLKEAEKHKIEYDKMVELAKKNEIKDILKKRKRLKEQHKQEASISSASSLWLNKILPNWEIMHQSANTRNLWWQGLPPSVRGKVWQLAIGNELNTTQDLYEIMVTRAHDKLRYIQETHSMGGGEDTESLAADRENTLDLIRLDISRTFPHLCIFQKGGPYHDVLHDILGAYTCYRPDVGYVQGMSFIAAMLLLNLESADAFVTFTNLLNKPCQVAFFRLDEEKMKAYFASFEVFMEENLPQLFAHFKQHNLTPDMYLIDWIFTMFSKALSLDTACRVWDVFCRDGEEFLFKTAIAILKIHSEHLLGLEFIHAAQCLTRLPSSSFTEDKLFETIGTITMVSRCNRKWKDVVLLLKRDEAVS